MQNHYFQNGQLMSIIINFCKYCIKMIRLNLKKQLNGFNKIMYYYFKSRICLDISDILIKYSPESKKKYLYGQETYLKHL